MVWQTGTVTALAIVECTLIWFRAAGEAWSFYIAALLAFMPMIGFFAALLTRRLYSGTLSDPGGIPPVRFNVSGRPIKIDMNLAAEAAGSIALAGIVGLYRLAQ